MKTRFQNSGMSAIATLLLLIVIAFFALCAFKVTPLYYKNIMLVSTLEGLDSPAGSLNNLSNTEIRSAMLKAFQINALDVDPRQVVINRDNGQTSLVYDYEARTELFANIAVVVSFEARYPDSGE